MLKELHIKNVVLIKDISVTFNKGFSVFTGETGAGKSILLDSLAMALGDRANYSMIGNYGDAGEIIAIFQVLDHPVQDILKDNYIECNDEIIIRRIITKDGKTRAFINDTNVSVGFLKSIGGVLLDIHGQFDNQKLLNSSKHRDLLDLFLEDKLLVTEVVNCYNQYKESQRKYNKAKQNIVDLLKEKEYIEYSLEELEELNPKKYEEKELLEQKQIANSAQRILDNIGSIEKYLTNNDNLASIRKALKQVESLRKILPDNPSVNQIEESLEAAYSKLDETIINVYDVKHSLKLNEVDLKEVEERLMEIRTIAKKHRVLPDDLEDLQISFHEKLKNLDNSQNDLDRLEEEKQNKKDIFQNKAQQLSEQRHIAGVRLAEKVNLELSYLKLTNANFKVQIDSDEEGEFGYDKVVFKVKTNQSSQWGDIQKVASGGEMARFMLALKTVLAEEDMITTMILDEIDIGVGGEVALAIGSRLLELSKIVQLIVVTHSHQVASKGEYHYKVTKDIINGNIETRLLQLNQDQRIEEIARMISGDDINELAVATAKNFLNKK